MQRGVSRARTGSGRAELSRLLRGQPSGFSAERLIHFLTLLGRDVEITVKPAARSRRQGHLRVAGSTLAMPCRGRRPTVRRSPPKACPRKRAITLFGGKLQKATRKLQERAIRKLRFDGKIQLSIRKSLKNRCKPSRDLSVIRIPPSPPVPSIPII
jgi:hypothetical protein